MLRRAYHNFNFRNIIGLLFICWETFQKIILLQTTGSICNFVGWEKWLGAIKTFNTNWLIKWSTV